MQNKQIILGIDPGYGRVGIAILEKSRGKEMLLYSECFETLASIPHPERLALISKRVSEVIVKYKPNKVAVETLLWSKNKKTALQVAEARGIILSEAAKSGVTIYEYNPNQIKLAVTGYGKSDKKQVINMIERLVKIEPKKRHDDEYDAIGVALTCAAISLPVQLN